VSNLSATDTNSDTTTDPSADPGTDPIDGTGHGAVEAVEVRRNGALAAALGTVAALVAVAYLSRILSGGSWLDWVLAVVTGAVAAAHLQAFVDARVPLLVVDEQGVRIRRGRTWSGLPWEAIDHVEHEPRRGPFRDGRLVLVARDAGTDAPLSVPLALSTRVTGAGAGLTEALVRLAGGPDQVVEVVPEHVDEAWIDDEADEDGFGGSGADEVDDPAHDATADNWSHDETEDEAEDEGGPEEDRHVLPDPRPALARGIGFLAERLRLTPGEPVEAPERDSEPERSAPLPPMVASATPIPLRDPVTAARAEVRFEGAAALATDSADTGDETRTDLPEARQLRRPGSVDLVEDTVVWSDRVRPIAREGEPVAPLLIDDHGVEPAEDPVVGPELAAARTRLGLTVDQLAERTRIRPHVIESIEVDDFAPCGGDFYARGHLRTLARVLGVDVAPLLASYDERYADAPIDARRVFEAELATGVGGPIRSTRGGPNWSVLVAAVMAVVLAWSIVRLVTDSPVALHDGPSLGSLSSGGVKLGPPVPVVLNAVDGGAHVVVRDGAGELVFNGDLAFGDSQTLKAAPPVRVQSSDGSLQVSVDGDDRGPLGAAGRTAQNTFVVGD
jgi:hypothetical protein